ncbi:hypothetical protein D3C71_993500 [compost metagenome]
MTDTAHFHQFFCFADGVIEVFRTVHRQGRGQFFVCEWLAFINHFHFTNQDLSGSRNSEACQFSNFVCWLTNDGCV